MTSSLTLKTRLTRIMILAAALALAPAAANASTIVDWGSTWEYTFCNPTGQASWNISSGTAHPTAGCAWSTGPAPFGNVNAANGAGLDSNFWYNTLWNAVTPADIGDYCNNSQDLQCLQASPDNLWVRRTFNPAGYNLNGISWALGADNGFKLYLNGSLISQDVAPGFASRDEYTGTFSPFAFIGGNNYLAVALNDTGIATAFDLTITGDVTRQVDPTPAPEPGTIALFGLGGALLFASRKRLV